ncbi:homoserine kinase [Oceanobacillus sp. CAU 1775]
MSSFKITVPASSGNVGPGFDSMGLALNLYLTLEVTPQENWEFISPSTSSDLPFEEHFIYQIAKRTSDKYEVDLPPCRVVETSSIPLARGLGSSASAIVAGIEIANQLGQLNLSAEQKLAFATEIEGHPDNVAPSLFGGLVISTLIDNEIDVLKVDSLDLSFIAFIPTIELKTTDSRSVLPKHYANAEAALASGISNLTTAALLSGDYKLAGKMMEKDRFHEPYRKSFIPNYDLIKTEARKAGAYGTTLSGAGPTMLSFVNPDDSARIAEHFKALLPEYRVEIFEMDREGLKVEEI